MEFDDDILSLACKLDAGLSRIQNEVLPLLAQLDEDVLVAEYTVDEQARISLAAAFILVIVAHAYSRLRRVAVGPTDAQLRLKMERVAEYIDKLREITRSGEKAAGGANKKGHKRTREMTAGSEHNPQSPAEDVYGDTILFTEAKDAAKRSKNDNNNNMTSLLVQNLLRQVKKD